MQTIIDYIRQAGTQSYAMPGTLIPSECDGAYSCHLIETGVAVIYTTPLRRATGTVEGPCVVGLGQMLHPMEGLTIKMIHPSVVYSIPAHTLSLMIKQNNLWPVVASQLSRTVNDLREKMNKRKKGDTAALVYATLLSLKNESEDVRIAHSVTDYVSEITGLSSSTVSRTVDTFKKQRCIEVHNGLLIRLHARPGGTE